MLHLNNLPIPVQRLLRKIGADLRDARRRRRISADLMAERCSISRSTLHKLEKGNPGVAFGAYATAFFVLGMTDRLSEVADVKYDTLGNQLEAENLPQRVRNRGLAKVKTRGKS